MGILKPIEIAVAWIMVQFHSLLTSFGMSADGGWTWALSIVGLVIVIRIVLIPLFVKQIKASRGLQVIQPELKKIQDKYRGRTDPASRQAMSQETMELYKRTGTNPFASCLPILLQAPIFFALFRVLNEYVGKRQGIGLLTEELATQANQATLLGARISSTFLNSEDISVKMLTVLLIVLMSATTFITQKQLMTKNMPAASMDNPFARQQKILLYALPGIFAVTGVNFPIGVLIYWLTTNVWSMGQQLFVIRRMPAPGSPADKALQERRARRGKGLPDEPETEAGSVKTDRPRGQRPQPKRKERQRRANGSTPGAGSQASGAPLPIDAGEPSGQGPGAEPTQPGGPSKSKAPKTGPQKAGPKGGGPKKAGPQKGGPKSTGPKKAGNSKAKPDDPAR